jgi:hypothetical protein
MLRHSPKGSRGWIQITPVYADPSPTADSRKLSGRRFGRWRPLGDLHHVPDDPILMTLASFLGKRELMSYIRLAASTDFAASRLWKRWASLSPAAQGYATLWDLCHDCSVTRTEFVGAAALGSVRAGCAAVLVALAGMDLPEDVELAISGWFDSRKGSQGLERASFLRPRSGLV